MAQLQQTLKAHEDKMLEGGDDDLSTQSSHQPSAVPSVRTPAESFDDDDRSTSSSSSSVASRSVASLVPSNMDAGDELAPGLDLDDRSEGKEARDDEQKDEKEREDEDDIEGADHKSEEKDMDAHSDGEEHEDSDAESGGSGDTDAMIDDLDDVEAKAAEAHHHEVLEHFKAAGDAVIVGATGTGSVNSIGAPVVLSVRSSNDDGSGYSKHRHD